MTDYKELIEILRDDEFCGKLDYIDDAADAIEQLVAERDTAIEDLKEFLSCEFCKHNTDECLNNGFCRECSVGKSTRLRWEWRGVQEVEHEAD